VVDSLTKCNLKPAAALAFSGAAVPVSLGCNLAPLPALKPPGGSSRADPFDQKRWIYAFERSEMGAAAVGHNLGDGKLVFAIAFRLKLRTMVRMEM
jgi:hypothetical protein